MSIRFYIMSIYQELILDHYKHPHNSGSISDPDVTSDVSNPLCGDKIRMEALVEKGKVTDLKFSGVGCAISTASASMLTDFAKGKKASDLKKLDTSFILDMLGIELSPNRLKCALLPLEALHKLLLSSPA